MLENLGEKRARPGSPISLREQAFGIVIKRLARLIRFFIGAVCINDVGMEIQNLQAGSIESEASDFKTACSCQKVEVVRKVTRDEHHLMLVPERSQSRDQRQTLTALVFDSVPSIDRQERRIKVQTVSSHALCFRSVRTRRADDVLVNLVIASLFPVSQRAVSVSVPAKVRMQRPFMPRNNNVCVRDKERRFDAVSIEKGDGVSDDRARSPFDVNAEANWTLRDIIGP